MARGRRAGGRHGVGARDDGPWRGRVPRPVDDDDGGDDAPGAGAGRRPLRGRRRGPGREDERARSRVSHRLGGVRRARPDAQHRCEGSGRPQRVRSHLDRRCRPRRHRRLPAEPAQGPLPRRLPLAAPAPDANGRVSRAVAPRPGRDLPRRLLRRVLLVAHGRADRARHHGSALDGRLRGRHHPREALALRAGRRARRGHRPDSARAGRAVASRHRPGAPQLADVDGSM